MNSSCACVHICPHRNDAPDLLITHVRDNVTTCSIKLHCQAFLGAAFNAFTYMQSQVFLTTIASLCYNIIGTYPFMIINKKHSHL